MIREIVRATLYGFPYVAVADIFLIGFFLASEHVRYGSVSMSTVSSYSIVVTVLVLSGYFGAIVAVVSVKRNI